MMMRVVSGVMVALLASAVVSCCAAATVTSFTHRADVSGANPFRGWVVFQGNIANEVPLSLEFTYIGLNAIMTGAASASALDWSVVDSCLADFASRAHHAVLRLFVDYPGEPTHAVPSVLLKGSNPVTFTSYSDYGGGQSPDYSNERLVQAMELVIAEFGRRYDNDTRLAFVQVGLLGFWGEWHTYPRTELFAPRAVQLRILRAFDAAFDTVQLVVSQDELESWQVGDEGASSAFDIGWHDDAFCLSTYAEGANLDWYSWPRLQARGLVADYARLPKPRAFAGEIMPELQADLFSIPSPSNAQPWLPAVSNFHASWLLNNEAFSSSMNAALKARTAQAGLAMGYQFHLAQIAVAAPANAQEQSACVTAARTAGLRCAGDPSLATGVVAAGSCLCAKVSSTVVNKGNAPFLFDIALLFDGNTTCSSAAGRDTAVSFALPSTEGSINSAGGLNSTQTVRSAFVLWAVPSGAVAPFSCSFAARLFSQRALEGNPVRFANAEIDARGRVPFTIAHTDAAPLAFDGSTPTPDPDPAPSSNTTANNDISAAHNKAGSQFAILLPLLVLGATFEAMRADN